MEKKTKPICSSTTQVQTQTQLICSIWIPWDLWFQILSFLPARSLVGFRSVCKSFLFIIDDPEFVSLHLRHGNASKTRFLTHKLTNSDEEIVYEVRETNNLFAFSPSTWNNKIIDRVIKPGIPTTITPDSIPNHSNLKSSLNGLLLLRDYSSCTSVALWNPSIKKHRRLSLPSKGYFLFGLGQDPSSSDYKLLAFDQNFNHRSWVYSVKMDTWTEILDDRFGDRLGVEDGYYHHSKSLSLTNSVFWICYYNHWAGEKLVRFDFETERFHYVEMPYSVDEMPRGGGLLELQLDCGSSVGVWRVDVDNQVLVWALETDAMSWTLRYKIAPPHWLHRENNAIYRLTYCSRLEERNGELVCKYWEPDGRVLSVRSYEIDVETKVCHMKFQGAVEDCLDIYFESLVMLK